MQTANEAGRHWWYMFAHLFLPLITVQYDHLHVLDWTVVDWFNQI